MELTLNSMKIYELGEYIAKFLNENGLSKENDLVINVTKDELRKIDEDLYYRNKPEGQEFVPSEGVINVNFDNVKIIIKNKSIE